MLKEFRYNYYLYRWLRFSVWLLVLSASLLLWWISGGIPPLTLQLLILLAPKLPLLWNAQGPALLFTLLELAMLSLLSFLAWGALAWMSLFLGQCHWKAMRLWRQRPVKAWSPSRSESSPRLDSEGNVIDDEIQTQPRVSGEDAGRQICEHGLCLEVGKKRRRRDLWRAIVVNGAGAAALALLHKGALRRSLCRRGGTSSYLAEIVGVRNAQILCQQIARNLSLAVSMSGGHTTMSDALTYSMPRMRLPQKVQLQSSGPIAGTELLPASLRRGERIEQPSPMPKQGARTEWSPLESDNDPGNTEPIARPLRLAAIVDAPTRPALPPAVAAPRQLSMRPLEIGVGWHSGLTRRRNPNEDSLVILQGTCTYHGQLVPFGLFVVADGMGGHDCGLEASRIAIQSMMHTVLQNIVIGNELNDEFLSDMLIGGVEWANRAIYQRSCEWNKDMGTTLTAALIVGTKAYIVNVGDSRTYIYRDSSKGGELLQITHDHSVVARLVALGQIAPHEIYTHPDRNQVYRSLGNDEHVDVDWFITDLFSHDRLLLCSDGLWELVRDPEIGRILKHNDDPMRAGDLLIQAALRAGGTDNVSAVVVAIP